MNSNMVFGQYYNSNSWIHRLDPRTKILAIIFLMVGLFMVNSIYTILSIFALTIILILSSKVPFGKFLNNIKTLSFLLLFTCFFQVFFRNSGTVLKEFNFTLTYVNLGIGIVLFIVFLLLGKVLRKGRILQFLLTVFLIFALQIYYINGKVIVSYDFVLYEEGLVDSAFLVLRIITLICISLLLTLTTKPTELNVGLDRLLLPLKKIKINTSVFTMIISIALRFIPTLINETNKILKAQASRGVDFNEGSLKDKISQIVSLIIPMFIIAYRRASDLAEAMEARGYDPDGERTSIAVLKLKASDYIVLILSLMIMIFLIIGGIWVGL